MRKPTALLRRIVVSTAGTKALSGGGADRLVSNEEEVQDANHVGWYYNITSRFPKLGILKITLTIAGFSSV